MFYHEIRVVDTRITCYGVMSGLIVSPEMFSLTNRSSVSRYARALSVGRSARFDANFDNVFEILLRNSVPTEDYFRKPNHVDENRTACDLIY